MPIGNPMGYAQRGKQTAQRVANYAGKHKMKTAMGVTAGMGTASYMMGGRRGRGVDKTRGGRPTGMYGY